MEQRLERGLDLRASARSRVGQSPRRDCWNLDCGLTPTVLSSRSGVGPENLHFYPVLLSCTALSSAFPPTLGRPVPSSQAEPGPGSIKTKEAASSQGAAVA